MACRQQVDRRPRWHRRPAETLRAVLQEGLCEYELMVQADREEARRERRARSLRVAHLFQEAWVCAGLLDVGTLDTAMIGRIVSAVAGNDALRLRIPRPFIAADPIYRA